MLDSSKVSFSDSVFTILSEEMEGHLLCTAKDIVFTNVYSQTADKAKNTQFRGRVRKSIHNGYTYCDVICYTVTPVKEHNPGKKPSKFS